jgi:hypothetical protein
VLNEGHIYCESLAHAGIGKVLCHSLALGFVRQLLANLREIVRTRGILDVGSEFGALAHQVTAPAQAIPGGTHFGRIDIGLGQHPAPEQDGDRMGINLIVLGFTPMNGFPREGMAQDKGNPFLRPEVG